MYYTVLSLEKKMYKVGDIVLFGNQSYYVVLRHLNDIRVHVLDVYFVNDHQEYMVLVSDIFREEYAL